MIRSTNPTTGEVIEEYDEMSDGTVDDLIRRAHGAHLEWRKVPLDDRSELLREAASVLRSRTDDYARLMALEMGKPVGDGRGEVEKCAWTFDFYADNGAAFLEPEVVKTDAMRSYVTFQPLGVVLAVMPWNFPFWQVMRFVAPALMAGNAGVLKHASNVPGSALAIEEVVRDAGFPRDLFRTLLIGSRKVDRVIEDPHIKAVTLTGSAPAGRAVAGKAGQMLKRTVLELGGSDPYVVLEDADLEGTVATCVASRLINGGQSCIAAKRFVVVEPLIERFEELYVEKMRQAVMGDPLDEATTMGPMARHDLRDELHDQVQRTVGQGARLLLGGEVPGGPGAFYPATVLTGVRKGMAAYGEELFGPVATIIAARDEEDAVRIANDTAFGLGSAVFTRDLERGERIARDGLEAGSAFVNTFVRSDPRLPFGGIKESGYGRELSHYGIREFMNAKTVFVGGQVQNVERAAE
ncbi:MAG: aldehyde dehydrogenase family protein [Thermoplasmata archaeon]|nr:aldehyde dehydrogenase family protein [Thermoplasmata archaeon]